MKILITGKNLDIGESLRSYIENSIQQNIKKYFDSAISAHITLSKEGHHFKNHLIKTDIIVNDGTGNKALIKVQALEPDSYQSFDDAVKKMGTQLKRYKSKIKSHHAKKPEKEFAAIKYTISPFAEDMEIEELSDAPLIIAEKTTSIQSLSVSDAVMQMDLLNLPALLFINSRSYKLNLVYYRKDGNISWLDSNILA